MRRLLQLILAATCLTGTQVFAQSAAPEIPFDSIDPLVLPDNIYLGEAAGVATNSKGEIFVYTRTGHPVMSIGTIRTFARGGSRLFQFDRTGKFVREVGAGTYAFLMAQQVRIDPQDNIWIVDQMSSMVLKIDPNLRLVMTLGRKAESETVPFRGAAPTTFGAGPRARDAAAAAPPAAPAAPAGSGAAPAAAGAGGGAAAPAGEGGGGPVTGPPGSGRPQDLFNRPTDVAWDAAGNIYIADGLGNSRIAKFDKNGKFVKSWGSTGTAPGQFREARGIAIDAQGLVYVADAGNQRIQVFDGDGNVKTQFTGIGTPSALCITPAPRQYLYSSNSNPPDDIDVGGEIYKLDLSGKVLGKFGRAGKPLKEFGTTNAIDCRSENELYVGELINWRVQKVSLHPK
jgi:DNA-binding beta-propeller fold protein YncE